MMSEDRKKLTIPDLKASKAAGERLVMAAVGEVLSAAWAERAGIDILGIGDSLGMTLYGHENTLAITVDQMIEHTKAVRRGAPVTSASVLQCDHDERKGGDMPNAITCAGVPPMIHLHHTLPSWPVGRWEHGIPGHWRTFSARQRGRSGGAAMGVGLQKERRGSAAD